MTLSAADPLQIVASPPLSEPTRWAGRAWRNLPLVWCVALLPHAVAFGLAVHSAARGRQPGNLVDFLAAAAAMLKGNDIYASGTHGYVYPPLIAFLYQPLAMLTERSAALISLTINAAVSVFTLVLVSRVLVFRLIGRLDPLVTARAALFGAACTADKIKGEFAHVETNVFMLLCFTLAMRWVDKRPWLCGLALGFAFNIKYMPLVLVPYLMLRRRWKAIGWFAVWAAALGLLPAASIGLRANRLAWVQATGGLLRLFGVDTGVAHAANVREITDAVSISLTSGLARVSHLPSPYPLLLAAAVATAFCLWAVAVYVRNRLPVYAWPAVPAQAAFPYRGLLSIEWMTMLLMTLIFSPFTNSRHLYMLLDVNIAVGVLLFGTRGLMPRRPVAVAAVLTAIGITFPPGGTKQFDAADQFWRNLGGPAWCMLGLTAVLLWTNVRYQRAAMLAPEPTT